MRDILKFLNDPMKVGVHFSRFRIDLSGTEKLYRSLAKSVKGKPFSSEFTKVANSIKKGELSEEEVIEKLGEGLIHLMNAEKCPSQVSSYISAVTGPETFETSSSRFRLKPATATHEAVWTRLPIAKILPVFPSFLYGSLHLILGTSKYLFKPHYLKDATDVVLIEKENTTEKNIWLFDVTTIKESGLKRFREFVKSIPYVGKSLEEIKTKKTYSSRFTFRPYPLATSLWLKDPETRSVVHEDLCDFLQAAVRYHHSEEWRTSIVLSAITVESLLADLYEEKYQEHAPNVPLGELYKEVGRRITFPPDIKRNVLMTNEARISAVHRSRFPVSEREATNALYGATTFTLWYFQEF